MPYYIKYLFKNAELIVPANFVSVMFSGIIPFRKPSSRIPACRIPAFKTPSLGRISYGDAEIFTQDIYVLEKIAGREFRVAPTFEIPDHCTPK